MSHVEDPPPPPIGSLVVLRQNTSSRLMFTNPRNSDWKQTAMNVDLNNRMRPGEVGVLLELFQGDDTLWARVQTAKGKAGWLYMESLEVP